MLGSRSSDAAARSRPSALLSLLIAVVTLPAVAAVWIVPGRGDSRAALAAAPPDTVALYGPGEFVTPTGLPQTYVEEFTASVPPGAYQAVRIVNG